MVVILRTYGPTQTTYKDVRSIEVLPHEVDTALMRGVEGDLYYCLAIKVSNIQQIMA
jgi:hypothetical protein